MRQPKHRLDVCGRVERYLVAKLFRYVVQVIGSALREDDLTQPCSVNTASTFCLTPPMGSTERIVSSTRDAMEPP